MVLMTVPSTKFSDLSDNRVCSGGIPFIEEERAVSGDEEFIIGVDDSVVHSSMRPQWDAGHLEICEHLNVL